MLRTRHRVATYGRTVDGRLVEVRIDQQPTPELAMNMAAQIGRARLRGALAYTVKLNEDGDEIGEPSVLAAYGAVP